MKRKNSATSSSKAQQRSRKGNGAAQPSTDPILDDLLGLNRKAVVVRGQRLEFRRDGEYTVLERRRFTLLGNEFDRLQAIMNSETAQEGETEADCERLDVVTRDLISLAVVGELPDGLGQMDREVILDLFFHLRQTKREMLREAERSISWKRPTLVAPATAEPRSIG